MTKESVPGVLRPLIFGEKNLLDEAREWLKVVLSVSGAWAFLPVWMGVAIVYVVHFEGGDPHAWKKPSEALALWLMGGTVAVFLVRSILFRLRIDIILCALAAAFLCREIHFTGTHRGIYVAAAAIGAWAWIWRDRILAETDGKKQLKVALFCMFWSYLIAILIQKRVFRESRIAILPDEQTLHIALEEVTENFSHAAFLLVGVISCFVANTRHGGLSRNTGLTAQPGLD